MADINSLSDKQIKVMIANYRRLSRVDGGIFSLSELLVEQSKRIPAEQTPREIVDAICRISRESIDGLTSYKVIFSYFYPERNFVGHACLKLVGNMLGIASGYCAANCLPALTTLVVPDKTRQLTQKAMENIHTGWQEFGRTVETSDARAFCEAEVIKARELAKTWQTLTD